MLTNEGLLKLIASPATITSRTKLLPFPPTTVPMQILARAAWDDPEIHGLTKEGGEGVAVAVAVAVEVEVVEDWVEDTKVSKGVPGRPSSQVMNSSLCREKQSTSSS